MPMYTKMERRRIIEKRNGAIYRTAHVGFEWYEVGHTPPCNVADNNDMVWCPTMDYIVQREKPLL